MTARDDRRERASVDREDSLYVVSRERLRGALRPGRRPRVCVLTAAAGWGKSASVREYGDADVTAWVALGSPGGGDLAVGVRSAVSELVGDGPGDQRSLHSWLHSRLPDTAMVLTVDGLERIKPDSPEAQQLRDVCVHGPGWLSVVLLSRHALPFSVEPLRGQGGVAEFGAEDLGYSNTETEALVRATVGADPSALSHLVWRATGGWPGAVHHLLELVRDVPPERRQTVVERFAEPGQPFHRYLLEQVLGEETADSMDDLWSVAVCAKRSGPAVSCPVWNERLLALARRGLIRPAADRGWELMPPLREHFNLELRRSPRIRTALHRRLSWHCGEHGALSPALGHAVASGDSDVSAALLTGFGARLVQTGAAEDVQRIADIDVTTVSDPAARIVGQARQVRGQWVAALAAFRRAGANREVLEPELAWRLAQLACDRGEFAEALDICARSDPRGERTAGEARVLALTVTAGRMVGDHPAGGALVERAEAVATASDDAGAHAAVYLAAFMHAAASGNLGRAEAYRTGALDAAARAGDTVQELRIRVMSLEQWAESRDPFGSREEADAAVRLGRQCGDVCGTALALNMRGRTALRAGRHEEAAADFTEAKGALERIGSRLLVRPLCGLADVHRLCGQRVRALAAYERALEVSEHCRDVVGTGAALVGIARVSAAEDLASAMRNVDRAVASGETTCAIPALVTRGWLRLRDGDSREALRNASRAAELARKLGEEVGIAESLVLRVLAADEPTRELRRLPEAEQVWQEAGCGVEAAAARVVAGRLSPASADPEAARAAEFLRDCGVDVQTRQVAGPLQASAHRTPPITVRTLGTFQVWRDGVAVPVAEWKSRKARDLLKILVAHRRPAPRELLRELLWPEVAPGKSANRLSVLLFTLREVLQPEGRAEDGPVAGDGTAVWLDRSLVELDVETFLARSWAALDLHRRESEGALEALLGAERLYTGAFLEGDTEQQWAVSLAEEVASTWWSLLSALATCWETAGDTDNAARCLVRLLDVDTYDERVHLDLVALLQRAGRFGAARRRHAQYVQRMMEIGVEPRPAPVGRGSDSAAITIPGQR